MINLRALAPSVNRIEARVRFLCAATGRPVPDRISVFLCTKCDQGAGFGDPANKVIVGNSCPDCTPDDPHSAWKLFLEMATKAASKPDSSRWPCETCEACLKRYWACQGCGNVSWSQPKEPCRCGLEFVFKEARFCCNRDYHHHGTLCTHCGQDERTWK